MKRFVAVFNDGAHVNTPADRMVKEDNMIFAYNGQTLAAAVDLSCTMYCHISTKQEDATVAKL